MDDYTLRVCMPWRSWKQAESLGLRCGCELQLLARRGLPVFVRRSRGRVFFFAGLLLAASLLFLSSLFIWEIDIQGCDAVSEAKILNALEECGVELGAFWPMFDQDLIRSEALLQLPELHWITVNSFGSRATVLVKERVPAPELLDETAPTALVAARDGIVDALRVTRRADTGGAASDRAARAGAGLGRHAGISAGPAVGPRFRGGLCPDLV